MIYQIYPRSFADANGDGVGDLRGVIEHLDYLNDGTDGSLGVAAIWLSPIYSSPMADFGYDVSDHTAVDPVFGDLEGFDPPPRRGPSARATASCSTGCRTTRSSEKHPWFRQSR